MEQLPMWAQNPMLDSKISAVVTRPAEPCKLPRVLNKIMKFLCKKKFNKRELIPK